MRLSSSRTRPTTLCRVVALVAAVSVLGGCATDWVTVGASEPPGMARTPPPLRFEEGAGVAGLRRSVGADCPPDALVPEPGCGGGLDDQIPVDPPGDNLQLGDISESGAPGPTHYTATVWSVGGIINDYTVFESVITGAGTRITSGRGWASVTSTEVLARDPQRWAIIYQHPSCSEFMSCQWNHGYTAFCADVGAYVQVQSSHTASFLTRRLDGATSRSDRCVGYNSPGGPGGGTGYNPGPGTGGTGSGGGSVTCTTYVREVSYDGGQTWIEVDSWTECRDGG